MSLAALTSLDSTRSSVTFACYYPTKDPLFLPIKIQLDAWNVELLKAVQVELQLQGREVSKDNLRLFKVTLFIFWQTAN